MTDGELLERFAQSHDEEAFETLVRRHGPMVLGVCRRLVRDDHDAEDTFQATFLVLVRNSRSVRKHDSIGSWLFGVAHRLSMKARVRAGRRDRLIRGETMAVHQTDDRPQFELNEVRPVLYEEVERLPEKYRAPIVLCYLEGCSHEAAAQQLSWPLGTVKGRLARAREVLHSRLIRRGIALALIALLEVETEATAAVPDRMVEAAVAAAVSAAATGSAAAGSVAAEEAGAEAGSTSSPFFRGVRGLRRRFLAGLGIVLAFSLMLSGGRWLPVVLAAAATKPPAPGVEHDCGVILPPAAAPAELPRPSSRPISSSSR